MIKRLLAGILAVALLLLGGCGADARHEIYRVYEGQNEDWTLEVRLWVEYNKSVLLPKDFVSDDSGVWTRTYWKITYHGDDSEEKLGITRIEVGDASNFESWSEGREAGSDYLEFEDGSGWASHNSYTNGNQVGDSEACYALLTDKDGNTIRIDAPLTKSKGNKY